MEASLPISAGNNSVSAPGNRRETVSASAGRTTAPVLPANASIKLPLAFVLTGVAALLIGMIWLTIHPELLAVYHYGPNIIAVTHLFVLGWICSVVMGAVYQLVPVALETKLYSERLARWQLALHLIGFSGMVWMFHGWNMKHVGHFGCVLATGIGLFVYNVTRTLFRVPRWNVIAAAIASALGWICFAALAGLSIAAGKCVYESNPSTATPLSALIGSVHSLGLFMSRFEAISAMHAHAHLGAVGLFTMLIVGVSYKLIPMFTLSEIQNKRRAALSVALLNIGLGGSFISILLRSPWKLAFALVTISALALYGFEMRAILRARKRRPLDWGIRYFLTAIALLGPLCVLAIVLSWPGLPLSAFTGQLENVYGLVGLIGFVSFAIFGMLYKIVPFLVWFGTYSKHIGRARVPALAEMYCARLQAVGYWAFLAGLSVTVIATLCANAGAIRWGCALLVFSVITLAANIGRILTHYFRPKLVPFAAKTLHTHPA